MVGVHVSVDGLDQAQIKVFEQLDVTIDLLKHGIDDECFAAEPAGDQIAICRRLDIEQLTEDHSLLNDYIRANKLTPEEIEAFPHKNVIVRALGMKETVQVDVSRLEPMPQDIYLLCSDGLSGPVTDPEIQEILTTHNTDMQEAANALITRGNENGGPDNITAVLVKVTES